MNKKFLTKEFLEEKEMLKMEFEKIFHKNNWVEAMTDQEYIQEYSSQYQIFIEAYYLFKN